MQACGAVIASKDALIAGLKAVLKDKDEEYVRALKRAAADIEALLVACHRSFQQLQAAYRNDLAALERSFLADRTRLLARSAPPPVPPRSWPLSLPPSLSACGYTHSLLIYAIARTVRKFSDGEYVKNVIFYGGKLRHKIYFPRRS